MPTTDQDDEFGLIHVPGSTDEVHVLDGKVRAGSLIGRKAEEILTSGEARLVNIRGELEKPPELSAPFTKKLPGQLPYLHFSFDQVKVSRTPVTGKHPALPDLTVDLIQSDDRHPVTRLTDGRFGKALSFDGKGDFMKTNWPGVYGAQAVTVAFWLRPRGNPNFAGIVSWGTGKLFDDNSNQWKLVVTPGGPSGNNSLFRCAWGNNKFINVPVKAPKEEWIHLAMVYTGESSNQKPSLRFYLNGIESLPNEPAIPEPPRRPSDLSSARMLAFGHPLDWPENTPNFNGNFLRGDLDEVFIIEGALTQNQIIRIYQENKYTP